jgi:O-antigen/teichoic acid export membrane protein
MNAGVGNLVAEGNEKNTMKVFWELTAIRFLITGAIILGLLIFLQDFVTYWFGMKYRLDNIIVYLLLTNIFIYLSRGVVENYISAFGLYSDVWTSWLELALNICVTICLAPFYGIVGILLGKIVSVFFIALFWKPYFLFSKGLNKSVSIYWKGMIPYYTNFAIFTILTYIIYTHIIQTNATSLIQLIFYGIILYPVIILCFFLSLFYTTRGMKYFVARKAKLYKILSIK